MTAGWRVVVEIRDENVRLKTQFFYAHISDRIAAVEAVKNHFSLDSNVKVYAIEPLLKEIFAKNNIAEGQIVS